MNNNNINVSKLIEACDYVGRHYKRVNLYETNTTKIVFVKCKADNKYDRIKFVKLGNEYRKPEVIVVYRYEDEQLIEGMLNTYGYKE